MRVLPLFVAFLLASCASGGREKYAGWQQVRIVAEKPTAACVYKAQEACSYPGAKCFTWYKQRATMFAANTVFLVNQSQSTTNTLSGSSVNGTGYIAGYSQTLNTSLADYYACPAQ